MKECLIDTGIFSYYMRGVPHVVTRARNYLIMLKGCKAECRLPNLTMPEAHKIFEY